MDIQTIHLVGPMLALWILGWTIPWFLNLEVGNADEWRSAKKFFKKCSSCSFLSGEHFSNAAVVCNLFKYAMHVLENYSLYQLAAILFCIGGASCFSPPKF